MGILYWALNHTKRQAIELGKAYGCHDLKDQFIEPRFRNIIKDVFSFRSEEDQEKIHQMLWDMSVEQIATDGDDIDQYYCDYVVLDSVYTNPQHRDYVGKKLGECWFALEMDLIQPEWLVTGHPDREQYIELYKKNHC